MEGTIVNYCKSCHVQKNKEMVVKISSVHNKASAHKLLDKGVVWKTSTGKEIHGKVIKAHGNSGALRVRFERGLPGQSVSTKVKII